MKTKIKELIRLREEKDAAGGLDKLAQRRGRGLMTARDRIEYLFDPNTFVELQGYVAHRSTNFGLEKKKFLGDGVITGFG
jgi:acetyl-CoA carboxylase carboxyltransferase component